MSPLPLGEGAKGPIVCPKRSFVSALGTHVWRMILSRCRLSSGGIEMTGALAGVRVIDFGQYIAGPLAAVMLSDQGAEVIHVDPPGGPRWKTPADAFFNRGKRCITLNLKRADDLTTAQRLVDSADVLIENFRPGVM